MRLGRRLSSGVADDPPAASASTPDAPVEATAVTDRIASPDQRAVEIVTAAAQRELGELAPER